MKSTLKAEKVKVEIDKFIAYFFSCRGHKPTSLVVSKAQQEALGIQCPYNYKGVLLHIN